jgi:hypothetical protein
MGYTDREASFLCVAALHGGYFLRRQYAQFLGKALGGTAAALIEKVLAKGHGKGTTYATNTHIYHLCARPFYAALGQEDNRNRRLRQPISIRTKLMGLDFVLAHRDVDYLATEQEKIDYFTGTLQLDRLLLPRTRYGNQGQTTERYFVEKFPIFVSQSSQDAMPPAASFCYVDEGSVGLFGFETFLQKYGPLLASLREFHLIYVAARDTHLEGAQRVFARRFDHDLTWQQSLFGDAPIGRLVEHFEVRRLFEAQQWAAFDRAKLVRFRDERQEFSGPKFDALYEHWKAGGEQRLKVVLNPKMASGTPGRGTFSTYKLEHNYDLFGSIAA